jgi:hypothetical protein
MLSRGALKKSKTKPQENALADWEKAVKRPVVNRSLARLGEARDVGEIMKDRFVCTLFLTESKIQEVRKRRAQQVLVLQRKCATELAEVDGVLKKAEESGLLILLLYVVPDASDQVRCRLSLHLFTT